MHEPGNPVFPYGFALSPEPFREYRQDADQAFPGNGRLKPDDEELRLLRKENAELKVENSILKKVTAIFSKGQK